MEEINKKQDCTEENTIVFNIRDDKTVDTKSSNFGIKTVLGAKRVNPYTTTRMADAYRSLYGGNQTEMPTTDLYVELKPHSGADLKALDSAGIEFFDYPIEYEVITMGDYYQELNTSDEFPILYAVVKPDTYIPIQDYSVIDNLYLDYSNPLLVGESFLLTGNLADINDLNGFTFDELGGGQNSGYIINNNNIECDPPCVILYREINRWTVNGSWTHLCWGAATVNNGFYELNDYLLQDGMPQLNNKIDILLGNNSGSGYCLMGAQYTISALAGVEIGLITSFWSAPVAAIVGITTTVLPPIYLPEVFI